MKDLGELKPYVLINIDCDFKKGVMKLDRKYYIETLAKRCNIENSKLCSTSMQQSLNLEQSQSSSIEMKYRNLIGELLYDGMGTPIDISYSANYLSRFQNCYDESHLKYTLRALKYHFLTRERKLTYQRNINDEIMDSSVDADWAGSKTDRQPTTG
ncbi:PREDICTED: uncharacterized protein LOC108553082 [Eufriesea mexicana]|uniref:uncharacterized protein LOC108553082 n=1 Tax=Eufriesea mexicana TaxID=516756 RepID=UPI00083BB51E|nr:PREDICTED: uncharacterized protein LOC108553082 [Eufriesea mexicana]